MAEPTAPWESAGRAPAAPPALRGRGRAPASWAVGAGLPQTSPLRLESRCPGLRPSSVRLLVFPVLRVARLRTFIKIRCIPVGRPWVSACAGNGGRLPCLGGARELRAGAEQPTAEARGSCRLSFQNERGPGRSPRGLGPHGFPIPAFSTRAGPLAPGACGQAREPSTCPGRGLGPLPGWLSSPLLCERLSGGRDKKEKEWQKVLGF